MTPKGVTIRDKIDGYLSFDLKDLLAVLGEKGRDCVWRAEQVEALGQGAAELHRLSDLAKRVNGSELFRLADTLYQVVDGTFTGFLKQSPSDPPWVVIRAVDSSFYDVESSDPSVLDAMRKRFKDVTDLTQSTDGAGA